MIEYREARESDLPSLLSLYRQLNPADGELNREAAAGIWREIAADKLIKYFIALEDGQVISACFIKIIPNLTRGGRGIGFIENVVTDERYRRRGLGREILRRAVEYARAENCYKAILQSSVKRKEAHVFYASIGFDGDSKKAFEIRFE